MIGSSVAFALGGAFMKASVGFTRLWPSLAVAALFLFGAFLLTQAVRAGGLTTAYTLGLGVDAVLSIVVGMYWFGERLSLVNVIGVALILVGVAGVHFG